MTEQQLLLQETVDNVFQKLAANGHCLQSSCDFNSQWHTLQNLGIDNLFIPEDKGGFSGSWEDARIIFYLSGRHGIALPICETIVAKKLLLDQNIPIPQGAITIGMSNPGCSISKDRRRWTWGGHSGTILTSTKDHSQSLEKNRKRAGAPCLKLPRITTRIQWG